MRRVVMLVASLVALWALIRLGSYDPCRGTGESHPPPNVVCDGR